MGKRSKHILVAAGFSLLALTWGAVNSQAYLSPSNPAVNTWPAAQTTYMGPSYLGDYRLNNPLPTYIIGPGDVPDYLTSPNWAYSPPLRKFIDRMPGLGSGNVNGLGQYIPIAVPDIVSYPGSDYYVIRLQEYREQMHSDLPPVLAGSGGTLLRGYIQTSLGTDTSGGCTDPILGIANPCTGANNTAVAQTEPHYLGPVIIAKSDRPVRIKFINELPATGAGGELFVPVDTSIMGAGPYQIDYNPETNQPTGTVTGNFTQNRANLHLHGGRSPWISDGTPHQWITPAADAAATNYPKGVSVSYVPDMWYNANSGYAEIPACAKQTTCGVAGATNNPGPGAQTYYYTNQQSARMMFYHDHAWGITRLNVYVGGAAGYVIRDATEQSLIDNDIMPGVKTNNTVSMGGEIALVIQDKTYVDPATIKNTDPTWAWGSQPWNGIADSTTAGVNVMTPVKGDLWWPHVYSPAQNPFDISGIAPMGRWAYGPYFWPATGNFFQPVPNPYYSADCVVGNNPATTPGLVGGPFGDFCQPPEIPSSPNPSWGAEAFMDTPTVNGTAYPVLEVDPKAYRLRVLNASHDRFFNLQMYIADPIPTGPPACADFPAAGDYTLGGACAPNSEVRMVPAGPTAISTAPPGGPNVGGAIAKPATWPEDGRPGGVPDWSWAGPSWIMIGNEGGFLPRPVTLPNQPINWNTDVTTFNAGNVNTGSLILAPAERADVIVDFSAYAGQTLILYNDAPAPWPALDPHYDYYTGAPDNRGMGGSDTTPVGFGPNTRTIMQIKVAGAGAVPFVEAPLLAAFNPAAPNQATGVFRQSQDNVIVAQGNMNPTGDPALYEAFPFDGTAYDAYNNIYGATLPAAYPNWGVSRINDKAISFKTFNADGTLNPTIKTVTMKAKAIQDEQGETFDEFGRMRAGLGLTASAPGAGQVNFVVQTYSDPSTEVVSANDIQIWKITHNGVDTHPIHFHLFDVQVLNRVGWDGFIRLPDPTELGWKETVRISPLEDTIVAIRPIPPVLPFGLPNSVRPLNPATPLGDATQMSPVDPVTGQAWVTPNLNRIINFGHEYVWHCHILSHEENDMMRPVVLNVNAVNDILWRNSSNGTNAVWFLNGVTQNGSANLSPVADQNWKIVGLGDLNSDGKRDILWRNLVTGQNNIWFMNGTTQTGSAILTTLNDPAWKVAGLGDFNNDGKLDIVWRNTTTGKNSVWFMNGATQIGSGQLPVLTDQNWKLVAIADFNTDGKPDLIWRNTSNGKNAVWYMNGVNQNGSGNFTTVTDQNWKIVGAGDFNNDVYPDLVWRNTSTGVNTVWYMNGTKQIGTGQLPPLADQNWKLVGSYYGYN